MTTENKTKKNADKVIKETVAEYSVTEHGSDAAQARPKPRDRRPLADYSDAELEAIFAETAELDREMAEEGIEEYAQYLKELDNA